MPVVIAFDQHQPQPAHAARATHDNASSVSLGVRLARMQQVAEKHERLAGSNACDQHIEARRLSPVEPTGTGMPRARNTASLPKCASAMNRRVQQPDRTPRARPTAAADARRSRRSATAGVMCAPPFRVRPASARRDPTSFSVLTFSRSRPTISGNANGVGFFGCVSASAARAHAFERHADALEFEFLQHHFLFGLRRAADCRCRACERLHRTAHSTPAIAARFSAARDAPGTRAPTPARSRESAASRVPTN